MSRKTVCAGPRNSRPALESETRLVLRSNTRKPTRASSSATSWLTAEDVSDNRPPAATKLNVSATASNASSCRIVSRVNAIANYKACLNNRQDSIATPQHWGGLTCIETSLDRPMPPLDHAALAKELHEAERSRVQIRHFSKRFPKMTLEDSYAIQREWVALKKADGRRVVGHKIGLTSRAMQLASQITEPDYGTLLDDMVIADGATLSASAFYRAALGGGVRVHSQGSLEGAWRRSDSTS